MSDSETSFPEQPTRWGRLKRSHSHDDADSPIIKSPRNFLNKKGVQSTRDLSTSKTKPKNGGRVFRPRRLNNNDDTISTPGETRKHASGDLPRVKISSKLNRFRKAGASTSLDGILMSGVSSSNPVGRFGLRRRKGGKTEDGAPISNQNCEQVDSDVSDCDGMSSSGDGSVANPKYRPSNRGRRPAQKQPDELPTISTGNSSFGGAVGSRSQGSALRTGKFQPRGENLPAPRRAVSFGDSNFNETEVEPCRQRAASSDQAPEAEDEAAKFGYNLLDFPIHNSTSMTAMPSVSTGAAKRHASERARYSIYHGSSATKKRLRVRPYHCFAGEPMYMTEEEIYTDSLVTSKSFVQLKSYLAPSAKRSTPSGPLPDTIEQLWGNPEQDGRIGALRVEILGCVSLNRTKPDVSAYAVCGDSAFCTDVISNYRSPMWPSVSRRACTFPIHHAFAKLYVGVFDVCIRKNKENDAFCGRVSIDLAAIRPNTEYDTTMPLRASTFVYDKRKRGVVRLRFSLHWFNERAAVTSYFKPVRGIASSCPMVDGQPTIPCADPKTFRNVAVTVYGQDLPGKYSKHAFRATMRELILYQQNAQQIIKSQVLDAVLYEKPWISLYMFCGAMYCVIFNSMSKVPAIFMGYFLILYIENYFHFVENKTFNLGYKPLTIAEVLTALLMMNQGESRNKRLSLESIKVEKRAKRRGPSKEDVDTDADIGDSGEIVPLDHREFPFADRDAYPKFSVEDSLAPGTSKGLFKL